MESGDEYDIRGAKKQPKLKDEKKEPAKKWIEEARRIANKDDDILERLRMKKKER